MLRTAPSLLPLALVGCLGAQAPSASSHWAYLPLSAAAPPTGASHPIDAWLLRGQRAVAAAPLPDADPATLLRRLYLDLIGLPPDLDELDAFLADPSLSAYERTVDRLLASPQFGVRMAPHWLDLARYGDSDGYNFDRARPIWPYRDWVVDAFNQDLPFDRFTAAQLAGDLLPDADEASRIATGFQRNTMWNDEGGADPDEARFERELDRASTTGTVWFGSTFHCARCHDHKSDPLTQREFYGLVAFFTTQDEATLTTAAGPKTLVLAERAGAKPATDLRIRGAYDARGDTVGATTPAFLPPLPAGAPTDRLTLARWLSPQQQPLVARVQANRLWTLLLGQSLVDSPEDFGRSCPPPLQLELLDWLAAEFCRGGQATKPLVRLLVTSAAYRRSAAAPAALRALDPDNRRYLRGSRARLDAERLRDTWLSIAGLLDRRLGGPPVFPAQADTSGVVPTNKVDMKWPTSPGADRYRRSLYTYVRRTAPFVLATTFDAPSREFCTVRRQATNSPLQALAGLADPTAIAAAEALGAALAAAPGDDDARLALGFRRCTGRWPDAEERTLLRQAFDAEPPADRWRRLALTLLNLDETLCRG